MNSTDSQLAPLGPFVWYPFGCAVASTKVPLGFVVCVQNRYPWIEMTVNGKGQMFKDGC